MTTIRFKKETHVYEANVGDGVWTPYTSVTTVCGRYSPPFPKDMIASKVAESNSNKGLTPDTIEEVLESWDKAGEVACDFGNAVHGAIEMYLKYDRYPKAPYLLEVVESFKALGLGKCISERILFNDSLNLAGTLDIIELLDKDKREVALLDLKTNGELYKKKGKMLAPFNHLDNNNINKYRLQLSLYAYLLEKQGYTVKYAEILHVVGSEIKRIRIDLEDISPIIEELKQNNSDNK